MNNVLLPNQEKSDPSYVFVPSWFVRAFERAMVPANVRKIDNERTLFLLPILQKHEFSALLLLLQNIQKQVLYSAAVGDDLVIDLKLLLNEMVQYGVSIEDAQHATSLLPSLRLVNFDSNGSKPKAFFKEEIWQLEDGQSGPSLKLKISLDAMDSLSGFYDAHLSYLASYEQRAKNKLSKPSVPDYGSIQIDLGIWMKLSDLERVVWLRMMIRESSSTIESSQSGISMSSLEELTRDLELSLGSFDEQNLLMDRLRLIAGLGRKLSICEFVKEVEDSRRVDIKKSLESASLALVWQPIYSEEFKKYCGAYGSAMSQKMLVGPVTLNFDRILKILLSLSTRFSRKDLSDLWAAIRPISGSGIVLRTGKMVQLHVLFLEWVSRIDGKSRFPLFEEHVGKKLWALCASTVISNAEEQFRLFKKCFENQEQTVKLFREQSCQLNPFSVSELDSFEWIKVEDELKFGKPHAETAKPVLIDKLEQRFIAEKTKPALPTNRISVKQDSQEAFKKGLSEHKLKQIALEELEKMMIHSPSSYANLKSTYLETLDSETRTLVMDVQRRLDSKAFDRHLKMRLVRYMTDFPSSWKSISTPFKM